MPTSVETFMQVASQLITEAAEYAKGSPNEETSASIRQVRTMCAALMAALEQVRFPAPIVTSAMPTMAPMATPPKP